MASAEPPEFDKRVAAAMSSFALSAPKRTKSELGLGDLSDVPIRFSGGKMVFKAVDVSPKTFLSALVAPPVRYYNKIDMAAREIKKLFEQVHFQNR